jgi:hypothetical protein
MATDLNRIRVVWTGIPTGTGVSTFYSPGAQVPNLNALRLGLDNLKPVLAPGITLTIQNQGDTIDDASGELVGTWATTAPAAVVSTGAGAYAAPTGGCVNWQTNGIHNGRRLRGRTFVVPLTAASYGTNGQLIAGAITALQGLINGVLTATSPPFVIWGRPVAGAGGTSSAITGGTVPTKAVVLTSRRD